MLKIMTTKIEPGNMKTFHFVSICILFLCSCNSKTTHIKNSERFNYSDFGNSLKLISEDVILEDAPLKFDRIYLFDSILCVKNIHSEFLFSFYDIKRKIKITDCFRFGNGPEDFIHPEIIDYENGIVWILDYQKQKLFSYNLNSLCDNKLIPNKEVSFNAFLQYATLLKDKIASVNYTPGHKRITLYSFDGDSLDTKGDFPIDEDLGFMGTLETCQSYIATNTHKNKIYLFYKRSDLVEIYDTDGTLLKRKHGPEHFMSKMQEYDAGEGNTKVAPSSKEYYDGYFNPRNVGEDFFVLYSGKENTKEPNYLMNQLFVFDNDGCPVKRFILDTPIFNLAVDSTNHIIYGITDQPDFRVIKYKY